jgi:hypothetical protein
LSHVSIYEPSAAAVLPSPQLLAVRLAGLIAAGAATVLAVVVNLATGGTAAWFPPAGRAPLWGTSGHGRAVVFLGARPSIR